MRRVGRLIINPNRPPVVSDSCISCYNFSRDVFESHATKSSLEYVFHGRRQKRFLCDVCFVSVNVRRPKPTVFPHVVTSRPRRRCSRPEDVVHDSMTYRSHVGRGRSTLSSYASRRIRTVDGGRPKTRFHPVRVRRFDRGRRTKKMISGGDERGKRCSRRRNIERYRNVSYYRGWYF